MSSPISQCTRGGEYNSEVGFFIHPNNIINEMTPPQVFDAQCAKLPTYQLTNTHGAGSTALHEAARTNNITLIKHIVRIGGKELLKIGDCRAKTPLFCAIEHNKRAATITLIQLGSDVNMQCLEAISTQVIEDISLITGPTPLAFVLQHESPSLNFGMSIQKIQKLAMAKILLIHGALAQPSVNKEGAQVLQQAEKEIREMPTALVKEINKGTESRLIPFELVKMIASYVPLDELLIIIPAIDPY